MPAGDFAYVSAHAAGVHVLDIRAPERIQRSATLRTQPGAFDMAVQGALRKFRNLWDSLLRSAP